MFTSYLKLQIVVDCKINFFDKTILFLVILHELLEVGRTENISITLVQGTSDIFPTYPSAEYLLHNDRTLVAMVFSVLLMFYHYVDVFLPQRLIVKFRMSKYTIRKSI